MTCTYLSQLIVSLEKQVKQSFLHLKQTRHQLSLDGVGLRVLDVNSVNSSSDYFVYLCIPGSESMLHQKKNGNCGLISPSMTDCRNQLQKRSLLAESHGCKAWIIVFFIGSKLQQLCCTSCTRL
jgi:hypothetical protein